MAKTKRTYQPKAGKRRRKHGFLARMAKSPHVIKDRRAKGRKRLSIA